LTPRILFDSFLSDAISESTKSYNQMAIDIDSNHDVDITKQGIDKRITYKTVNFIQELVKRQLSNQVIQKLKILNLEQFNRVKVKDSTKFDVSKNLADKLPGSGGSASDAAVCVQYEFDVKSGQVDDLNITPSIASDSKDYLSNIENVEKDDLLIRDLGYFSLAYFKKVQEKKAFFLSKLHTKINVYERNEEKSKKIDFGLLYRDMMEKKINRIEKQVFIGNIEKFPVRFIITLIPDEVYNQRMKKINRDSHKRGYQTTQEYKDRSRFNLFITNIPAEKINLDSIITLYRIRWQIELNFKIWKSVFGLAKIHQMKYERLMCVLYVRLLVIIINLGIYNLHRAILFNKTGKLLSINKCLKTLKDNAFKLRFLLTGSSKYTIKWVGWTKKIFESKHWLEKRKGRIGMLEILSINVC
jgi:hypothetical protein